MWPGEGIWNSIKKWWNSPTSETDKQAGQVYRAPFSRGVEEVPAPQTQGELVGAALGYFAMHYGGGTPGSLKMPATATAAVESVEVPSLGTRATEIHAEVNPATQRRTTIAVGEGTDGSGNTVRVVGSSEPNGLRKQQIAALKPGEIAATGPGHAEVTVMNYAKANDINIKSVGASRPICFNCALQIQSNGVAAVTPLKVVKKVSQ